jgi:hypothetical protein
MKMKMKYVRHAVCLFLMLFCCSCAHGVRLNAEGVTGADMAGTFTTIIYGCNYTDDPESVAFLDREGDRYTMEPYAPDFKYRVIRNMSGKDAFAAAEGFLHCSTAFQGYQIREVRAPGGGVIGYEVRQRFYPFVYGADDMLSVDYWLKDDRVIIQIGLHPWAEHFFFGGSGAIED